MKKKKVLIVVFPLDYDPVRQVVSGDYEIICNNVINIYHTLVRRGVETCVLNLAAELDGRTVGWEAVVAKLAEFGGAEDYSHVVFPVSFSESYNEFFNLHPDLIARVMDNRKVFGNAEILMTGRVLNPAKLREIAGVDFRCFPVSYREDLDIARHILENKFPDEDPLVFDERFEEAFRIGEIMAKRSPQWMVIINGQYGCLFECTFCERFLIWPERRVMEISMEDMVAKINYYREKYGRKIFMVMDPIFNYRRDYIRRFCESVRPLDILWHCECRVELLERDDLESMYAAGCRRILFGIETFDLETQKAVNKRQSREKTLKIVDECREIGIFPLLSFLAGIGKTVQDAYANVRNTGNFIHENGLADYSHGIPLFFYMGTRDYLADYGDQDLEIFPTYYHPFKIFFMIDFITEFYNRVRGEFAEVEGKRIYGFLELFLYQEANPGWVSVQKAVEQISRADLTSFLVKDFLLEKPEPEIRIYRENILSLYHRNENRSKIVYQDDLREFDSPSNRRHLDQYQGNILSTYPRIGVITLENERVHPAQAYFLS